MGMLGHLMARAGRSAGSGIRLGKRLGFQLGLRVQIAVLGLAGVALIAVIYLVGLQFEAGAQRTADESAALESLISNVTEGFLEARQLATQFIQKRDEKLIERHAE